MFPGAYVDALLQPWIWIVYNRNIYLLAWLEPFQPCLSRLNKLSGADILLYQPLLLKMLAFRWPSLSIL